MRAPETEAINLKCSTCDRPLMIDDASSAPAATVCCQGCGKAFGTVLEVRDAAAMLSEAESEKGIEDLLEDVPFLGVRPDG